MESNEVLEAKLWSKKKFEKSPNGRRRRSGLIAGEPGEKGEKWGRKKG